MIPFEESFFEIWNEILKGIDIAQKSNDNEKSIRQIFNAFY